MKEDNGALLLDDDDIDTMTNKYLVFKLCSENYGIDIQYVKEIIELQKIISIPDMPEYIRGVINLRGMVIPVMDLRRRFHKETKDFDDRTCIIVINIFDKNTGLIVDSVDEVVDIPEANIEPPPNYSSDLKSKNFIKGIGKFNNELKIILDLEKMIKEEDLDVNEQAV